MRLVNGELCTVKEDTKKEMFTGFDRQIKPSVPLPEPGVGAQDGGL